MTTCIMGYKNHILAGGYENNVMRTNELQYMVPDIKEIQPACLKKLKLLCSKEDAIKGEHTGLVRHHNLVLAK